MDLKKKLVRNEEDWAQVREFGLRAGDQLLDYLNQHFAELLGCQTACVHINC